MDDSAVAFILLGITFLLGLAADAIGRRTLLPRVTMVLIIGFMIGNRSASGSSQKATNRSSSGRRRSL